MQKHINSVRVGVLLIIGMVLFSIIGTSLFAQGMPGPRRWLRVGSLFDWYSYCGNENESARTGNAGGQQNDGLRWPAQFCGDPQRTIMNTQVEKGIWIGTSDYYDPVLKATLPVKVIGVGPKTNSWDIVGEVMPVADNPFYMVGRYKAPFVLVDGADATDNTTGDSVDVVDENLKADRMIVNSLNTCIGVSFTRKLYAFTNQDNDNYFIYEYVFKNTGLRNAEGTVVDQKTLTQVIFSFVSRYAGGNELFLNGIIPNSNINWGRNTVYQVIGTNPAASSFTDPNSRTYQMRAQYSWYGHHDGGWPSQTEDFGAPFQSDGHLSATQFVGRVMLHADTSPQDATDDPHQPFTTHYIDADDASNGANQYNLTLMQNRWTVMNLGHAPVSQADQLGKNGVASTWGPGLGGSKNMWSFGPYTLNPNDSIRIVFAEGVAGITREKCYEIGAAWKSWRDAGKPSSMTFTLPNGSTTTNGNEYKDAWVWTGEDSLLQTFRRAINNFKNGFNIPKPPPAPAYLYVNSGGDKISLEWASVTATGFAGYEVYRAIGRFDTMYTKIWEGNATSYDDVTAIRGRDYFYYVLSKDDGSTNNGVPLVSSKYLTFPNNTPARLQKPASSDLSKIRIVPNPYNIRNRRLQFGTTDNEQDKIGFYNLTASCTIKIYTERGDLIQTLNHTNGTGDQLWWSVTSSGQIIVSGVYIAVIESSTGEKAIKKFIIIR